MAVRGRRDSPWERLRDRRDIVVRPRANLDRSGVRGALDRLPDGRWIVLLCRHLTQAERTSELAHELEHISRGGGADAPGMPATWAAVVARDELAVDRAVADELVPPECLDAWLAQIDTPVGAHDVAAEWEVSLRHAELALVAAVLRAAA